MSNCTVVSLIEEKLPRGNRKFWALEVSKANSKVKDDDKFPSLLEFLLEQKRAIEYDMNDVRGCGSISGGGHHFDGSNVIPRLTCVMHNNNSHRTRDCDEFINLSSNDKVETIKKNRMCYSCLEVGQKSADCKNRQRCNISGCTRNHHQLLHQGMIDGVNYHTLGSSSSTRGACLLQIMLIKSVSKSRKPLTVFLDGRATNTLITFHKAAMLNLHGTEVQITVTKVGGKQENMISYQYCLPLLDLSGKVVEFQVYGIDKISAEVKGINIGDVMHLFRDIKKEELQCPVGVIDVLIGFEYAGFHPVREQSSDHLLVMSNRFGKCIGGSHELLYEGTQKLVQNVVIHHLQRVDVKQFNNIEESGVKSNTGCMNSTDSNPQRLGHIKGAKGVGVEDFYNVEVMGVNSNPKCGSCKCGNCPLGGKNYTLKEDAEGSR